MDYFILLIIFVSTCVAGPPKCRLSEFLCDSGHCVALDRFCNGENDCGDKSDEPRYCTHVFGFSYSNKIDRYLYIYI
ncbi:hypothetical protein Phum_PHUM274240 [Pediculus humanus corporis]|uniref:Low-density lipoprotein receptor n=1 Tax=Pediculus humanus subsp. corporis TaxID=121224 RepID=E0VKW6_PEDHC|nr:uncharacterized protein Phum_PHUM274240 [Pediculus humanus corporis]EEB14022.1 hypothetical protein Phum_PHUM274240 [Pediculus humanus corporis]